MSHPLATKIHTITEEISGIVKGGQNDAQHYKYVRAEDVVRLIREKLVKHKLVLSAHVVDESLHNFTETGGKQFVTTITINYELKDLDSDETEVYTWIGAGADTGGDKGLYKAYTGALKYFLLNLFLIPTGDDPETDTVSEAPERGTPRIPVDRAHAILKLAQKAELAHDFDLKAVLKAKLVDVSGQQHIGELDVDQAEAVEEWIAKETA